ncbi:hypothetical protein ScPMuIL_000455 [Solemya velum]
MNTNGDQVTVPDSPEGDGQGQHDSDEDHCIICMSECSNPKKLEKCGHVFCQDCITQHFKYKHACPLCGLAYGEIVGDQPEGYMSSHISKTKLPGYEEYNSIVVSYSFFDGIQSDAHPHPGERYYGTERTGFLPNCPKGQKVERLLKKAFDRNLVFTIGQSRTTGKDNCVIWNDIHHKTSIYGGPQEFGYPDPTYLDRVLEELKAKGVTE